MRPARHRLLIAVAAIVAVAAATVSLAARSGGAGEKALPYSKARYEVADARLAFRTEGVALSQRSRSSAIATLGNARDILEVDVFGDPGAVHRSGFEDLPHAGDCSVAGHLALHWRGNVRAILNCDLVANDAAWVARMDRALAALG